MIGKVICPDCGVQEARGALSPIYRHYLPLPDGSFDRLTVIRVDYAPEQGLPKNRKKDEQDTTCPKCCGPTLPLAQERTTLAHFANVNHAEFPFREYAAQQRQRKAGHRGLRLVKA